jgi:hypothetical protein
MARRAIEGCSQIYASRWLSRGWRSPVAIERRAYASRYSVERRIAAFVSLLERLLVGAIMLAILLPTFELDEIVR